MHSTQNESCDDRDYSSASQVEARTLSELREWVDGQRALVKYETARTQRFMRRLIVLLMVFSVVLAGIVAWTLGGRLSDAEKRGAEVSERLSEVGSKTAAMEQDLPATRVELERIRTEVDELASRVGPIKSSWTSNRNQDSPIDKLQDEDLKLREELERLRGEVSSLQKMMSELSGDSAKGDVPQQKKSKQSDGDERQKADE